MRDQARRLDENQKKLSEQLEPPRTVRQTLAARHRRAQAGHARGSNSSGRSSIRLLDQMRNTVQDAEETEPLLAKNLYDTVRKANEQKIPDALKAAEQLAELGVAEDAAKSSRHAGQGIEQLREGVERVGPERARRRSGGPRRAQGELEDLADQINHEIAQATGQEPATRQDVTRQAIETANAPAGPTSNAPVRKPLTCSMASRYARISLATRSSRTHRASPMKPARSTGTAAQQQRQGQRNRPGAQGEPGQQAEQGEQGQQGRQRQEGQQGGQQDQQEGQQGQQEGQRGQQQGRQGQQQGQQGQQGGQGQRDQQGQQGQGQPGGDNERQDGEQPQRGQGQQGGRQGGSLRGGGGADRQVGADRQFAGGPGGPGRPITGEGFREWSDRMRDVEELLDNPELRAEAARIRDRARAAREEFKRHSKVPDWTKLKGLVAEPINELRDRVAEEVRRRESPDALVPIDRDPVPPQFAEGVRRYYERLGSGQ